MKQTDRLRGFRALPVPLTDSGSPRRCGIEIEFSGLDEAATARLLSSALDGHVVQQGQHLYVVEDTVIGTLCVELDTRFAKPGHEYIPEDVLDAARVVVPVEVVTPPLAPDRMDEVPRLMDRLRVAGAKGTSDSLFAGFGIHFNPEVPGLDHPHTLRCIVAYALLEPWIRTWRPLDMSRRVLPFVDPWPERFREAVITADGLTMTEVRRLYAAHMNGRNYGLDLLPILHSYDPEIFARMFGAEASGARPAFHFRLPDCRVDEEDWSITDEWDRWWIVEALAADSEKFEALREAWRRRGLGLNWSEAVGRVIGAEGERLFQ